MRLIFKPLILLIKILFPLALILYCYYQVFFIDIPDLGLLKDKNPTVTSFMLGDDNLFKKKIHSVEFVALHNISPYVVRSILTSEDDLFFVHNGFNWREIGKSLKLNLEKMKIVRGGSTITQQLARNLFLSPDKSIFRKFREWLLTYQLEKTLSKKRILELYLNYAQFGPSVYGVKAAGKYHFGTKPKYFTPRQSALLAAVLPSPGKYGKKPYPGITYTRMNKILSRQAVYDLHMPKDLFKKE